MSLDRLLARRASTNRRATIDAVRAVVLANLPAGYDESFRWGMLSYEIPLHRYPDTYNGKPLMYAALAAQKRYSSLYLTSVYSDPGKLERFVEAYRATGKRLDMGKSCVRFRTLDDLPLDVVADAIARRASPSSSPPTRPAARGSRPPQRPPHSQNSSRSRSRSGRPSGSSTRACIQRMTVRPRLGSCSRSCTRR